MPIYELYTDGSCRGNPGPGGWAYIMKAPGGRITSGSGFEPHTTNNRMELRAAAEGLSAVPEGARVRLHTDSTYLMNGLLRWRHGWRKAGFKRKGKDIPNADLWRRLDELASAREVEVAHVRGHTGDPLNEQCDLLARKAVEGGEQSSFEGGGLSEAAEAILAFFFERGYDRSTIEAALKEALSFLRKGE